MAITNPILPPKDGYVEVIDENGNHVYEPTPKTRQRIAKEQAQNRVNADLFETFFTLLGFSDERKLAAAEQFRKVIQFYASNLPEEQAIEIAMIYPEWEVGKAYKTRDIVSYGTNGVGDPQLYKVVQDHTSQADWLPDASVSLYDAFGLDEGGYPIWSQPSGAHDAYNTGDIVNYNGTLYQSTIDGNAWAPDVYPDGWTVYTPETE